MILLRCASRLLFLSSMHFGKSTANFEKVNLEFYKINSLFRKISIDEPGGIPFCSAHNFLTTHLRTMI